MNKAIIFVVFAFIFGAFFITYTLVSRKKANEFFDEAAELEASGFKVLHQSGEEGGNAICVPEGAVTKLHPVQNYGIL